MIHSRAEGLQYQHLQKVGLLQKHPPYVKHGWKFKTMLSTEWTKRNYYKRPAVRICFFLWNR